MAASARRRGVGSPALLPSSARQTYAAIDRGKGGGRSASEQTGRRTTRWRVSRPIWSAPAGAIGCSRRSTRTTESRVSAKAPASGRPGRSRRRYSLRTLRRRPVGLCHRAAVAGDVPQRVRARRTHRQLGDRRNRDGDVGHRGQGPRAARVRLARGRRCASGMAAYANAWYGAGAALKERSAVRRPRISSRQRLPWPQAGPFLECRARPRKTSEAHSRRRRDGGVRARGSSNAGVECLLDCHGRFSPASAIAIAGEFEPSKIYWYEEPCDPENVAGARQDRALDQTPGWQRANAATRSTTCRRCSRPKTRSVWSRPKSHPCRRHPRIQEDQQPSRTPAYTPVSFHNPFGPVATAASCGWTRCTTNFIMQESFCEYSPSHGVSSCWSTLPRPREGGYDLPTAAGPWRRQVPPPGGGAGASIRPECVPADVEGGLAHELLRPRSLHWNHNGPPAV